ncbi:MAG: nitroreductase family protein [Sphaerochaeta sp.]|jgi:nitroreductase|nr:nitroreductase family protein [Sphaerochaeta sp.]MCH3919749.1 nitroreductase family protein [Sphaerochaeta sp.]MCI2045524.1 nitroreductase family protein [Sphaerochaeta sp.]MCI2076234.1 nitroreductase family protein [Sphaerochaeta sp.]
MDIILNRKSVRVFRDDPVPDSKIVMLLESAMASPSAGNQQPWEFYVVKDKTVLLRLSQSNPDAACLAGAPLGIVCCSRKKALFPQFVAQDMAACTENILLEAVAQGLGAVWLGIAPIQERIDWVTKTLAIPHTLEPFSIIAVGYAARTTSRVNRYDKSRIHTV